MTESRDESHDQSWLEGLHGLLDATDSALVALADEQERDSETIAALGGLAEELRRWFVLHPCPDDSLRVRIDLLIGRYGYAVLLAEDLESTDSKSSVAIDRLRLLKVDVARLVADVGLTNRTVERPELATHE